MINKRKSFITGLKSTILTNKEKKFLKKYKPWGIILFSRNIKSYSQLKKLTNEIKLIFNDSNYPILIDQEGGKINRFKAFLETSNLTNQFFGDLYRKNKKKFTQYYTLYINQMSLLLKDLGININTVPVLDLRKKYSSEVIGNRSYSSNPHIVSKIGDFCIKKFHKNGIATVMKHIPGHGLAKVDSHKFTPNVTKKYKYLIKNDFSVFKNKKSFFAMTAHIVYRNIDPLNTATHSKKVIKIIRNKIGYKNLIISDDISMKGLKFSIKENTIRALNAGCNLILHCNGQFSEMTIVAENSPFLDKLTLKKTSQFYKFLS